MIKTESIRHLMIMLKQPFSEECDPDPPTRVEVKEGNSSTGLRFLVLRSDAPLTLVQEEPPIELASWQHAEVILARNTKLSTAMAIKQPMD